MSSSPGTPQGEQRATAIIEEVAGIKRYALLGLIGKKLPGERSRGKESEKLPGSQRTYPGVRELTRELVHVNGGMVFHYLRRKAPGGLGYLPEVSSGEVAGEVTRELVRAGTCSRELVRAGTCSRGELVRAGNLFARDGGFRGAGQDFFFPASNRKFLGNFSRRAAFRAPVNLTFPA